MLSIINTCNLKEIPMKKLIGVLLLGVAVLFGKESKADGDFIVVNNPVFDWSGAYSDGYSTNGTTEYPQSFGQAFTLTENYTLSSLRWWGGMNNFFQTGTTNLKGFNIVVWDETFSNKVIDQTVMAGQYIRTATTASNEYGGKVYDFFMPFVHAISAGNYHMNIGALYNNAGPLNDQFVWSAGFSSVLDPTTASYTAKEYNGSNIGGVWGVWNQWNLDSGNPGGAFVLTAPAPGAIALLALGGLVGTCNRRRR